VKIVIARPEDAAPVWPQIETHIANALRSFDGCYHPTDILADLLRGERHLWLAIDETGIAAAVVCNVVTYPRRKAYNVMLVGGRDLRAWLKPMCEAIEGYAKSIGCRHMEGGFRRGWAKAAGYREVGVTLMKDL
jgi:hypothetical protein